MVVHVGIDSKDYSREKSTEEELENATFFSMIGCAVVTEDYDNLVKTYTQALQQALLKKDIETDRKVLCSNEILTMTHGNFDVHEEIFSAIAPYISKLNIFYPVFNSKRIPKIKVYGKKRHIQEFTVKEFYNKHLKNSFPHICLWKIYSYIYGSKAQVYVDHFQSEITEAWDIISKYPHIHCYIKGDMTNPLISIADIMCKLIDHRLEEGDLFLREDNIIKILYEVEKNKIFVHCINNKHLPKISMLHTNKVSLDKFIKRPIFYLYLDKGSKLDTDVILSSCPKFLNFINLKDGCVKFFIPSDIYAIKNNDYIVYVNKHSKDDVDNLKELLENQMNIKINACNINDFK
ncbi:MAG: hypothetical protein ACP5NW_00750 [Candidatus Woesearchaeota archaeon]